MKPSRAGSNPFLPYYRAVVPDSEWKAEPNDSPDVLARKHSVRTRLIQYAKVSRSLSRLGVPATEFLGLLEVNGTRFYELTATDPAKSKARAEDRAVASDAKAGHALSEVAASVEPVGELRVEATPAGFSLGLISNAHGEAHVVKTANLPPSLVWRFWQEIERAARAHVGTEDLASFDAPPLFTLTGCKRSLLPLYKPYVPDRIGLYWEPFFGTGAMFLWVRKHRRAQRYIINERHRDLADMYRAIQRDYSEFLRHVQRINDVYIPLDREGRKELYYEMLNRAAHDHKELPETEVAAIHLFARTACFNGIAQNGRQRLGKFSTGCGNLDHVRSFVDLDALSYWHEALQGVEITHGDWSRNIPDLGPPDWAFLDPPYRLSKTNYGVPSFTDARQVELIEWARTATCNVAMCNEDHGDGFYEGLVCGSDLKIARWPGRTHVPGRPDRETGKKKPVVEILIYRNNPPRSRASLPSRPRRGMGRNAPYRVLDKTVTVDLGAHYVKEGRSKYQARVRQVPRHDA